MVTPGGQGNLEHITCRETMSTSRRPKISCSKGTRALVHFTNLPLLRVLSGRETHWNPGGAASQTYMDNWICAEWGLHCGNHGGTQLGQTSYPTGVSWQLPALEPSRPTSVSKFFPDSHQPIMKQNEDLRAWTFQSSAGFSSWGIFASSIFCWVDWDCQV